MFLIEQILDFIKKHFPEGVIFSNWEKKYFVANLILVSLVFLFIGLMPLYPRWFNIEMSEDNLLKFSTTTLEFLEEVSDQYRIIIPSIGVNMNIVVDETNEQVAFSKGAWLLPNTAEPNLESGNTVIAAHRYMLTNGPNTFYNLDKINEGDKIIVQWDGKEFVYNAVLKKVVKSNAVEILRQTQTHRLTLFTCHPIYSTKERLVVVAELLKN